jgi:Domain of unknown function (DUF4340)
MNSKTLVIIAGSTLALVGLAGFLTSTRTTTSEVASPAASREFLYAGLAEKLGDVAKVTIKKGKQEAVVVRDGAAWKMENKSGYPAKFDALKPIVAGIAQAKVIEPKTSKPDLWSRLEVEDPAAADAKSAMVTLTDAKGATLASLIVGKQDFGAPSDDPMSPPPSDGVMRRFVRRAGENQSWLAQAEINVIADPLELLDRNVIEIKNERVKGVTIAHPASGDQPAETVTISKASEQEKNFSLANMPAGSRLKDEFAASRVAQALSYVTFDDVQPASAIDFTSPAAVHGTFECFDGTSIAFTLVEKDGKQWAKFGTTFTETPAAAPVAPATPAPSTPEANAAADINAKPAPATPATPAAKDLTEAQKVIRESVKKDAAELDARLSKWAYALPEFKHTQLRTKIADLIAAAQPAPENK